MNKHYILSLFDSKLKTVGVTFKGGVQEYTYKTYDTYEVGDCAVVETPSNGFQVVRILTVHEEPELDSDSRIDYKWLIQKVDLSSYYKQLEQDSISLAKIKTAERNAHRESARRALLEQVPSLGVLVDVPAASTLAPGFTKLDNGLAVNNLGAVYYPSTVDSSWVGPFDSVKDAVKEWDAAKRFPR